MTAVIRPVDGQSGQLGNAAGRARATTIAELQQRFEPRAQADAQLSRSFTKGVESSASAAKTPVRPRRKLNDIGEQRVLKAGLARLCSMLTSNLSSQELTQLPQRPGGGQLFMTPSFYQRMLRGETELKTLLEGDVSAAQSDLRHLRLEQLLTIRVATLDWATESHSHSAHTNFLMSLDVHLFERLARQFLRLAPEAAPKPATLHALGLRLALVLGAEEVIGQGWGRRSVSGGAAALPPLSKLWALPLGVEWGSSRVAFFDSRELWVEVSSGTPQHVQEILAGQNVAVTTDRSSGLGKDRVLHWEIAVLDPAEEDILEEMKSQDQAPAEQKTICSELNMVLKKRMSHRAKELGLPPEPEAAATPEPPAVVQMAESGSKVVESEPPEDFGTPEKLEGLPTTSLASTTASVAEEALGPDLCTPSPVAKSQPEEELTPPRPRRLSVDSADLKSEASFASFLGYPAEPKHQEEDGCFKAFMSCGRR